MIRSSFKRVLRRMRRSTYQPLSRIELSRGRTLHNVALVQAQHPNMTIIPVLKGNAYGHGLEPMAAILNDAPGEYLAVDGYFEADKIRHISSKHIIVMGYILSENAPLLDTKHCSFVVQDIVGLRALARLGRPVKIHVELNTGMNRLGLQPSELQPYLEELRRHPQLQLEGVMTHLADADNELDDSFTQTQVARFDAQVAEILAAGFHPKLIHAAQTAGSTKISSKYANAVRLGIGTYGINPLLAKDGRRKALADLRPVLELKSTIIKVVDLKKGEAVSYNCTFTAPKAMRIAVLPLGFYEGVPRELSNKGYVTTTDGQVMPIVGRVCMDHTMIDVSGANLCTLDEVVVISRDAEQPNSILGMQDQYGLFAYTTAVGLSSSVRREIVA